MLGSGVTDSDIFGAGLGGIGSFLVGGRGQSGFDTEAGQLNDISGFLAQAKQQGLGFLQPFQETGTAAIPGIQHDLGLLQDPLAARRFLLRGYATSPEAKMALETGTRASNQAGSASGLLGSGAQRAALQKFGQQVQSTDVDKFLGQQEGLFTQGLHGLQGQEQLGLGAGSSMANFLGQLAQAQAQAKAASAQAQEQGSQQQTGGIGGFISDIASLF